MSRGVLYYNSGSSCLVRLLVSLHSLREHYDGPVTILAEGEDSHSLCVVIGRAMGAEVRRWNCGVSPGANRVYLAKTRYHTGSPYEATVALDSDTMIRGSLDGIFEEVEQGGFCVAQFANWRSDGPVMSRRIMGWQGIRPEDVELALNFGPAINCGVVAFRRDSAFCRDWLKLAELGRHTFIPDEVACQLSLHRYPHRILHRGWNCSCKYDDPGRPDTRIIHYHGRKHCRPGLPFHANLWVREYERIYAEDIARITEWAPAGDAFLARYIMGKGIAARGGRREN